MPATDSHVWMEYLPPERSWRLLTLASVGRVGVVVDGRPEIYPVNYAVDGFSVVFRTDKGSKLRGLTGRPEVCFESDGLNFEDRTGWCVLARGRATDVSGAKEKQRLAELPVDFWWLAEDPHWIRIDVSEITGREIHRPAHEASPLRSGDS
jgi:nitroimidazol reductase NimA-like FMN-containing flavoprotein (pyridoxamine 5'-phosphate oxidase superfamily)